jgi:hypothetical protein
MTITTPFGFDSTAADARVVERREGAGIGGVAPYALDPANAERLWDVSLAAIA